MKFWDMKRRFVSVKKNFGADKYRVKLFPEDVFFSPYFFIWRFLYKRFIDVRLGCLQYLLSRTFYDIAEFNLRWLQVCSTFVSVTLISFVIFKSVSFSCTRQTDELLWWKMKARLDVFAASVVQSSIKDANTIVI